MTVSTLAALKVGDVFIRTYYPLGESYEVRVDWLNIMGTDVQLHGTRVDTGAEVNPNGLRTYQTVQLTNR